MASSPDSQGGQSQSVTAATDGAGMAEADDMMEADASAAAPSRHSAPAMPSQPAAKSPSSGQAGNEEPPGAAGDAARLKDEHKENEVSNCLRWGILPEMVHSSACNVSEEGSSHAPALAWNTQLM